MILRTISVAIYLFTQGSFQDEGFQSSRNLWNIEETTKSRLLFSFVPDLCRLFKKKAHRDNTARYFDIQWKNVKPRWKKCRGVLEKVNSAGVNEALHAGTVIKMFFNPSFQPLLQTNCDPLYTRVYERFRSPDYMEKPRIKLKLNWKLNLLSKRS